MIHNLEVKGLNRRFDYGFEFKDYMNLFTGMIGTGKTTLLKLIWFLTSGNLHHAISEIPFQSVSISTSEFFLSIKHTDSDQYEFTYQFIQKESQGKFELDLNKKDMQDHETLNKQIASVMESSLFFPTFRRIERHLPEVSESLSQLAEDLSVEGHRLIMAVSTFDIIDMLSGIHARLENKNQVDNEPETRDQFWMSLIDFDSETLRERWNLLNQLVEEIYTSYKGVRITEDIVLGGGKSEDGKSEGSDPIHSSHLSSGEKQLLGFLCYNEFIESKTIFIDEPELSLHPDWQRMLIPLLQYKETEKQFFIASHSPYIGSRYEDHRFKLEI